VTPSNRRSRRLEGYSETLKELGISNPELIDEVAKLGSVDDQLGLISRSLGVRKSTLRPIRGSLEKLIHLDIDD
jgi:hypothetical protein